MVALAQLWLPIFLSAVLVFVASSLVHMVIKWHNSDYGRLPNEEEVRAVFQKGNAAPGQYVVPWCIDQKEMNNPDVLKKYTEGPVGIFYLLKPGRPTMGPLLGKWFVYLLVVSFFTAYVASRTLPAGTDYLKVFQVAGATGFIAYSLGAIPSAIWMGKPWRVACKEIADGLLYGLVMAGTFGWLWPR